MRMLLQSLILVGVWNLFNLIARIYYKEFSYQYVWSIILGVWASLILTGVIK